MFGFGFSFSKGNKHPQRVVPLFETVDDLRNSAPVMRRLFSNEWYRAHIKGRQEIMIGYSDSAKDAGRLTSGTRPLLLLVLTTADR